MIETDTWASLSEQLATLPPRRRRWARLLVPDLAVCLAVLAVFCALGFYNAPQTLFRDSQTALELRAHTLFALMNRVAGLGGVAWFSLILLGVVTWLWVRLQWAVGGNFFLTLGLFAPFLAILPDHLRATSSLFGWAFLVALLTHFENVQARFTVRSIGGMAVVAVLWANLDRSFLFLPMICGIYALSHLIRPFIWPLDAEEERKRVKWFVLVALITLAAGWMSNPTGLRLPDPPALSSVPLFTLGLVGLGAVLALTQTKVAHFFLAACFMGYASLAVLLLLPMANGAIVSGLRKTRSLRSQIRKGLTELLQRSDHVRLMDARFSGLLWTVPAALLLLGWLLVPVVSSRTGFPRSEFPVDAAAEFAVLPETVRVLAPPPYADYLAYRFHGRVPVFTRGADLRPGWREDIGRLQITHALLPLDSPLAQALGLLGWKPIIEDNVAVLLRRPE